MAGEMVEEGPYGSLKGYTERCSRPAMKVTAITHRKELVLPFIVDGTKVSDTQAIISLMESERLTRECILTYQQPLRWLQIPPDYNLGLCFASVYNRRQGVIFRLVRQIFTVSNLFDKVVVIDNDIHPISIPQVLLDWSSKTHPVRDHHVLHNYPPALMPNYGEIEPGKGTPRMYIDACFPAWWKPEEKPIPVTFESVFPEDLQERVLKRWKDEFHMPVVPFVFPKGER